MTAGTDVQRSDQKASPRHAVCWPLILMPLYAVVVHVAVVTDTPSLGLAALALAAWAALAPALPRHPAAVFAVTALTGTVLALAWHQGRAFDLLLLPPIAVTATILAAFGGSLLGERTPLVTAIALRLGEHPTPVMRRYTRGVTIAWTIFLGLMLAECIVLALLAPAELWSLFTNFVNYLLIAVFFVAEFRLRRHALPGGRHSLSFVRFLRGLPAAWPRRERDPRC